MSLLETRYNNFLTVNNLNVYAISQFLIDHKNYLEQIDTYVQKLTEFGVGHQALFLFAKVQTDKFAIQIEWDVLI